MSAGAYLTSTEDQAALASMPLESAFRGIPIERVISRLKTERSLFEGQFVAFDPTTPWLTVVVLAERPGDMALEETLASLALQSCPGVSCTIVAQAAAGLPDLVKFIAGIDLKPEATEIVC